MKIQLLALIFSLCSINSFSAQILDVAEQMPLFKGCENEKLLSKQKDECSIRKISEFVNQNIIYPASALNDTIEGTVVVSFVVDSFGKTSNIKVIKEVNSDCGKEAVRVIKMFPNWSPAKNDGKAVAVRMKLPIRFNVKDLDERYAKKSFVIAWGTIYSQSVTRKTLLEHLKEPLIVRDLLGKTYEIESIEVVLDKKGKLTRLKKEVAQLDKKQMKLIKKAKPKNNIAFIISIQDGTGKNEVERVLTVEL
jgi:TonB family protein